MSRKFEDTPPYQEASRALGVMLHRLGASMDDHKEASRLMQIMFIEGMRFAGRYLATVEVEPVDTTEAES